MLAWPSWLGLAVVFGGPLLLVTPAQRLLGPPGRLRTQTLEQLAMLMLLAAVLFVVLALEAVRSPRSACGRSIGLRWRGGSPSRPC